SSTHCAWHSMPRGPKSPRTPPEPTRMTSPTIQKEPLRSAAVWLSTPNVTLLEIAARAGFGRVVLDLEHGAFDQAELNLFIPLARQLRFGVFAKVVGPGPVWIQQALDFGADGIIVPHILGVDHAREICAAAKYPPLGNRSFAGGRIVGYG